MREMQPQREIVVPGDARRNRGATTARRSGAKSGAAVASSFWASLGAAASWLVERCMTRPAESAGAVVVLGASGYIIVNALGLQHGRHPAPILPQPKQTAARDARPVPLPAARQDTSERPKTEWNMAAQKPATSHDNREAASAALTQLVEETTASVTPKADKAVLQAQQALSKLGYGPLKDDGLIGPGTRAAIERFERDHKLSVTGEASGRTLRELTASAARKR